MMCVGEPRVDSTSPHIRHPVHDTLLNGRCKMGFTLCRTAIGPGEQSAELQDSSTRMSASLRQQPIQHDVSLAVAAGHDVSTPKLGDPQSPAWPHGVELPALDERSDDAAAFAGGDEGDADGGAAATDPQHDGPFPDTGEAGDDAGASAAGETIDAPQLDGSSPRAASHSSRLQDVLAPARHSDEGTAPTLDNAEPDGASDALPPRPRSTSRRSARSREAALCAKSKEQHAVEGLAGDSDGEMEATARERSSHKQAYHRLAHA